MAESLRLLCGQCGEQPAAMVKVGTTDGWCTRCLDEAAEPCEVATVEEVAEAIEAGWEDEPTEAESELARTVARNVTATFDVRRRPRNPRAGQTGPMSLQDALGDAKVRFWMCPITAHAREDERPAPITVVWLGDVAQCTYPGCTLNSANTYGTIRMAYEKGQADERERIAQAIEARRNEHWQQHLAAHPYADARSCPDDYAKHDAYQDAANIARGD